MSKPLGQGTPDEIDEFAELVRAGDEVETEGLVERISRAHSLIFIRNEHHLVGVAALKHPNANYRARVFKMAQVELTAAEYPLELGWVYVPPAGRGAGLSYSLVQAAVKIASGSRIFATSRVNNHAMHKSLLAASFARKGKEYISTRGSHTLAVFTHETEG